MSMINTSLTTSNALQSIGQNNAGSGTSTSTSTNFSEILNEAISSVTSTESTANNQSLSMLTGDNVNIHNVVLAAEKADIALQLTLQIRNKVLDAYNEMMRMQI